MQLQRKLTAVVAACFMYLSMVIPASSALTTSSNPALTNDITATVTAHHGTVFKRDFVDWTKEAWGDPTQVGDNDKLREGMQIGTGNDSWAEVSWPNVKTRAWANTVFAVAPNKRLVYLTGGEMLFRLDKHRKDKDQPYYIWTKVLQARIRGTTVLVQATGNVTRFTVMEGVVDILNKRDHSSVTLRPGVVYEIKGYNMNEAAPKTTGSSGTSTPVANATSKFQPIVYDEHSYQPIFQTNKSSSNAYCANSDVLLHHPLLTSGGEIDSKNLIEKDLKGIPGWSPMLSFIKPAAATTLDKVIFSGITIGAVPSTADYFIGQNLGKAIKLPPTVAYLQFKGIILNPSQQNAVSQATPHLAAAPAAAVNAMIGHELNPPAAVTEQKTAESNNVFSPQAEEVAVETVQHHQLPPLVTFEPDPKPLPTQSFYSGPSGIATPAMVPSTCFTPAVNVAGAAAAFQPVTGSVMTNMAGAAGALGGVGAGAAANVGAFAAGGAGVGAGIVNGATGFLAPAAAGQAATMGNFGAGAVPGFGGVTHTINNTFSTVNTTINNTLGGLGRL